MRFFPKERGGIQISEVRPDSVLGDLASHGLKSNSRMLAFAKSRHCACCKIVGNRMFLEPMADGGGRLQYNLYAETCYNGETSMVLLTTDHVKAKRLGGRSDGSNLQVLCAPCNYLKDQIEGDRSGSINTLRNVLKLADLINKFSKARSKTATNLEATVNRAAKLGYDVEKITQALPRVSEHRREDVEMKLEVRRGELDAIESILSHTLLLAQVTGEVLEFLVPPKERPVPVNPVPLKNPSLILVESPINRP